MDKQKLLDLIGPAFLAHEINAKPTEQIINELAENIIKAYEQPDISEDVESEFELLLKVKNELFEADKLPFAKRVEANKDILNFISIKRKVEPIPTVDEDEFWNKVGAILNGSVSFSMYPKYLATLKQQFSITRK